MKVYIYFEGKQLLKTKLPKSWQGEPCEKVIELFADYYDKKNPGGELQRHLLQLTELKSGTVIPKTTKISDGIQEYADLQVVETEAAAPIQNPWTSGGHVPAETRKDNTTTVQAAASAKGFNDAYSKWDRFVDISDDEKDFHPNIDNNLMIRLKREKREQRKKEEAALVKQLETEIANGNEEAKVKLAEFYAKRDLCGDDLCEVKEERSMINSGESEFEKTMKAQRERETSAQPRSEDAEEREYRDFSEKHMDTVTSYASMSVGASEDFILENPNILQSEATGHLLIHMLELEMSGERDKMMTAARQYLMLQNIVDLSKQVNRDPRSSVRPFFREIQQEQKLKELEAETRSFAEKIIARAIVKKEERLKMMEEGDEEEYEEVPYEERLGPGGLDPVEVFPTLPESVQEAFNSKSIDALKEAMAGIGKEDAEYHFKRMIDSGLWVPAEGEEGN